MYSIILATVISCTNCVSVGVSGPRPTGRVACTNCCATGYVYLPCRRCHGEGVIWMPYPGLEQRHMGAMRVSRPCGDCAKGLVGPNDKGSGLRRASCPLCRGRKTMLCPFCKGKKKYEYNDDFNLKSNSVPKIELNDKLGAGYVNIKIPVF